VLNEKKNILKKMFNSAEDAAAAASKELVVLREAIDRNRTAISQTQHEILLLRSKQESERAAAESFLEELRSEMSETLRSLDRMQKMQSGPTVPETELVRAKELLEAKRNELLIAKREVTLLEGVLRIHADTPGLRLREQVRALYPEIEFVALGGQPQQQQIGNNNNSMRAPAASLMMSNHNNNTSTPSHQGSHYPLSMAHP
jgi:chromosome segregation ATPase